VASTIEVIQDKDVITGGNQKWNGAIPSFNIIADIKIRWVL
jgi:hypothetical protein